MKKIIKYLEDNNRAGEVEDFKKNINNVMKDLLGKFKDLQFFTGDAALFSRFPDFNGPGICVQFKGTVSRDFRPSVFFFIETSVLGS
jgi:hypothetical protein